MNTDWIVTKYMKKKYCIVIDVLHECSAWHIRGLLQVTLIQMQFSNPCFYSVRFRHYQVLI